MVISSSVGLIATPQLLSQKGYYGEFGGRFTPEILHETLEAVTAAYQAARRDQAFWSEFIALLSNYSGRPTPLTYAEGLTRYLGGAKIFIKREDLSHTGSHKLNNGLGQMLLAKRMGKTRVDRRNRGRSAWSRNCHTCCQVRTQLHHLYGCDRC